MKPFCWVLLGLLSGFVLVGCDGGKKDTGRDDGTARNFKQSQASQADVVLELPQDAGKLKQCMDIVYCSQLSDSMTLKTSKVKKTVLLKIPFGTVFKPVNSPTAPTYIASGNSELLIEPNSSSYSRYGVKAMVVDVETWGHGNSSIQYQVLPRDPESKAYAYIKKLVGLGEFHWLQAQIGLWVVTSDIAVNKLYKLRMEISSGFMGLNKMVCRIYSYQSVKQTGVLLRKLGYDPGQYRIFKQNRENFEKALAVYKLKSWDQRLGIGYVGNFFNSLSDYQEEPEVKALLVDYLTKHQYPYYRYQAMEKLMALKGLDGTKEQLLEQALNGEERMLRLAAAKTLYQQGDKRMIPVLMVYQDENPMVAKENFQFRQMLEKRIGRPVKEVESLLTVWENSGGWEALEKERAPQLDEVRRGVVRLRELESAYLDAQVKRLESEDSREFHRVMAELKSSFPYSHVLHDKLKQVYLTHKDEDCRLGAFNTLVSMRGFDDFAFLKERLAKESNDVIKRALVRCSRDLPQEQKIELLELSMKSPDPVIRLAAIHTTKDNRVKAPQLDDLLSQLCQADPSQDIRIAAINLAVHTKVPGLDGLIEHNLKLETAKDEKVVLRTIEYASNMCRNKAMFEKIKTVADSHPLEKVRVYAVERLYLFGADHDLSSILLDCVKSDKNQAVRLAALYKAASLTKHSSWKKQPMDKVVSSALQANDQKLRKEAIDLCGHYKLVKLAPELEQVALNDSSIDIRQTALLRVYYWDRKMALSILKNWLGSNDKSLREKGIEFLKRYLGSDPQARQLIPKP